MLCVIMLSTCRSSPGVYPSKFAGHKRDSYKSQHKIVFACTFCLLCLQKLLGAVEGCMGSALHRYVQVVLIAWFLCRHNNVEVVNTYSESALR